MKIKPPSTPNPGCIFFVLLLATMLAGPQRLAAQEITITVRQIAADNSGGGIDSGLGDVRKDLQRINYDTFRLKKTGKIKCATGKEKKLELLGGNRLAVRPLSLDGEMIRFELKLSGKKTMDTVFRLREGGTFIIVGPSFEKGVLILAFTASR